MDKSHGPRVHAYQNSFSGYAAVNEDGVFGYVGVPTAVKRDFSAGASATEDEFKTHAKQFKRTQLKAKLLKKLVFFSVFMGIFIVILGAIGLALNHRYAGRALPYSYIGDISIGGLTAPEIKRALDKRAEQTEIVFTEAGLTKKVSPKDFSAWFDTEKAAHNAIVGFNPFTYLTKRSFSVPVTVDENQVDGYIRLYIANKQTASLDAKLVKQEDKLAIKPERYGSRTSSAYVASELQRQLSFMKDPVVNLSAAYEQPKITQEDLKDDLERANTMINTDVSLQIWSRKVSPTVEDKISWLDIKKMDDTNELSIEFNEARVREYIFGLAEKYTIDKEDEKIAVNEAGSQYITQGINGQRVKNIEKVANDFYTALGAGQNGLFAFEFDYEQFVKIDRESVNLITIADEAELEDTEEDAVALPDGGEITEENQDSEDDQVAYSQIGSAQRAQR